MIHENLKILQEVLFKLKSYDFDLNLAKFVRDKIKYFSYIVSPDIITISPRHRGCRQISSTM